MTGPSDAGPAERTDLAWQRTGLGLLAVGGLLAARALEHHVAVLLVVAGATALMGLAVLGIVAPLRYRTLRRRRAADDHVATPRLTLGMTLAVVAVAVASAVAVLVPR